ncbi:MAG: hypothetical protein E6Q40_04595 [Cupriavidus sp.]|nr:MAG: hypothetical protein E6Q40_04595 [Cupriavidus sp.]
MTDWCILRTSGRSTLTLYAGLVEAGYDVWTPVETIARRIPRKNETQHKPMPIMPTYIFARSAHVPALFALIADPRRSLPDFSVLRYRERIPLIADNELQALRRREERSRRSRQRGKKIDPYRRGEMVKAPDGAFGGMSGVVINSDGKTTWVNFGGLFVRAKIDTFLLRENEIGTNRPIMGTAA